MYALAMLSYFERTLWDDTHAHRFSNFHDEDVSLSLSLIEIVLCRVRIMYGVCVCVQINYLNESSALA